MDAVFLEWFWRASPLGERGERAAAKYLRRRRYMIVDRGFRTAEGEIDLVAVQHRTIVFVEVKTRRCIVGSGPLAAVTREKQRRISRTALVYLTQNDLLNCATRFDVMGIIWPRGQRHPDVLHVENAFEPLGTTSFFF